MSALVSAGVLTVELVEEALALLKRDEARLFPRDRKYRDDLIRLSKGEASFLEVFGAGHILRPEPSPKPPGVEVSPAITPPEAPVVDAPLTLSEAPAIGQPGPPPEPAVADEPVLLSEQQQAPLEPAANEATAGGATWKPRAQEPKLISVTGLLIATGMALAVILLAGSFWARLFQHHY